MSLPDAKKDELALEIEAVFEEQSAIARHSTSPVVKALIGTAPFAGGISSILGDVAASRQERRLRKFLLELAKKMDHLDKDSSSKLDYEFLDSDDFSALIESVLQEVLITTDKNKLAYFHKYIGSSIFRDRPDVTWRQLFLGYIRQLSGLHLSILSVFYKIQGDLPNSDRLGGGIIPGVVPLGISKLEGDFLGVDALLLRLCCIDLNNVGLVIDWKQGNPKHNNFQTDYCISESGKRFHDFLRILDLNSQQDDGDNG